MTKIVVAVAGAARLVLRSVVESLLTARTDFLFWSIGRDWQIDFGPIEGKKGEMKTLEVSPQCLFRGEKMMASDTAEKSGCGTRIGNILIGQRLQRPAGALTMTIFFSQSALGNGVVWDACERYDKISLTVHFNEDCSFDCTVFGRAVL